MKKKKSTALAIPGRGVENSITLSTPAGKVRRAKGKCVVCGSEVAPFSLENLCWICRRLKISAWRDAENQAPMQE